MLVEIPVYNLSDGLEYVQQRVINTNLIYDIVLSKNKVIKKINGETLGVEQVFVNYCLINYKDDNGDPIITNLQTYKQLVLKNLVVRLGDDSLLNDKLSSSFDEKEKLEKIY